MEFQFYLPVRVVAGPQAVRRCGPRFAALGKKCLIVTGRHAAAACGALGDVTEALRENGVSWELFDEVGENPLLSDCVRAAALCRACGASFVVGIGGGSPMDAAKAIALLAANPQITGDDLYTAADRHPALPIALVGTTSGTGSEVSAAAVLTDSTGPQEVREGRRSLCRLCRRGRQIHLHAQPCRGRSPRGSTRSATRWRAISRRSAIRSPPVSRSSACRICGIICSRCGRAKRSPRRATARSTARPSRPGSC